MNLEKLINMVVNQVVRRLVSLVLDRGVNFAAERMKPSSELSDEEKTQGAEGKKLADKAREMQKMGRKLF